MRETKGSKKGFLTRIVNKGHKDYITKDVTYKDVQRSSYSNILDHESYLKVIDYFGKGVDPIDYVLIEEKRTNKRYLWIGTDRGTVAFSV